MEDVFSKMDNLLAMRLKKTGKENPYKKLNVLVITKDNPEHHVEDLEKKQILIRQIIPSDNSMSIKINSSDLLELAKNPWVTKIEPVFLVRKT